MSVLVVALYAEGSTDDRFLPPIIQRTAERIIAQYGQNIVVPPLITKPPFFRLHLEGGPLRCA